MTGLLERYRTWRYGPLTRDRCETCGVPLRVKRRVERSVMFADGLGGTAVTATYCKAHAPEAT